MPDKYVFYKESVIVIDKVQLLLAPHLDKDYKIVEIFS